ncbi:MAG TPA: phage portal protein [Candidatus Limnocylindrales bacterium]|nr:phage portal protein [Candidatus Limnocylindrales bacterium]
MTLPAVRGGGSRHPAGSSEWWLERLTTALHARQGRFTRLEHYYRGTQDLSKLAGQAWRESEVSKMFPNYLHANHSKLIVNAAAQRLNVLGFRFSGETGADAEAARIWRANEMHSESSKAHVEALVKGECPVLVEPNPADPSTPIITPQDPAQVIVWHAPGDRRLRQAALKSWWDLDSARRFYILYLPDRIEHWRDREPSQMDWWLNRLVAATEPARWELRERPGQPGRMVNPLGEVPIVVLPNDPRLNGSPEAEHEPVLSRIDHYNKTLMDMAVTSHEMAYPQRWGTGVEPEEDEIAVDEVTGEPIEPAPPPATRTGQTRWITTPEEAARFGQFTVATLDNYVKELDQIRADIATDTFTPYHFLLNMPSSVPPSGESITASEAPLVDKVRAHGRDKGAAWRQIMRLALRLGGDEQRAQAMRDGGQVIWEDPERRTESQHVDALGKLRQMLGLPLEATWELLPASPEDIERWRRMLDDEAKRLTELAGPEMAARSIARTISGGPLADVPDNPLPPAAPGTGPMSQPA